MHIMRYSIIWSNYSIMKCYHTKKVYLYILDIYEVTILVGVDARHQGAAWYVYFCSVFSPITF